MINLSVLLKYEQKLCSRTRSESEADPDPNQRGGRRGGRDLSGGAAGGAETISGVGAEGHILYQGGQEGGQVIFEGGLVPPLAPPWIRHCSE